LVCANCHKEIHFDGEPEEKVEFIPKPKPLCLGCGKEILDAVRCRKCDSDNKYTGPTKDQLIQDNIDLKNNFCAMARKYKVSDNAIRKWFKRFDLSLD
jgi:predicted amidophosphoribosyltransferase